MQFEFTVQSLVSVKTSGPSQKGVNGVDADKLSFVLRKRWRTLDLLPPAQV